MKYIPFNILMSNQTIQSPDYLDSIVFEDDNIEFKVYGVLHALTGGTNKEYVEFVNKTIAYEKSQNNFVFSEKAMKKMYRGIDKEVEDWIQVPTKDLFTLGLKMILPHNICKILFTIIKEKVSKNSRFNIRKPNLQDIGGSPFFHLLKPSHRRIVAGFSNPEKYLNINLARIINNEKIPSPKFPDKDWSWLSILEPHVNIPIRSIHMFEYAKAYAKKHNLKNVALFVGEIHNSDIDWYVNEFDIDVFSDEEKKVLNTVYEKVEIALSEDFKKEKFKYFFFSMLPVTIFLWIYLAIAVCLLTKF